MKHSRSSLFLMELLISILFFSLASAVCIQLFAKSHTLGQDTVNQNNAIVQAQNLAESWLATGGDLQDTRRLLENCIFLENENRILLVFDKDWTPLTGMSSPDICYTAELSCDGSVDVEGLLHAVVKVSEVQGDTIYSLKLDHHIPERRGNHE